MSNTTKISFDVKYGRNTIEIPFTAGKSYGKSSPELSNLNNQVFTIINQIPTSQTVSTKVAWEKYRLDKCGKSDGLRDESSKTMAYKANTWTAYIGNWQEYKPPTWLDDGYYALSDDEKAEYYTANVGDLLIFADIPDETPTTLQEFNALRDKYKDIGGIITSQKAHTLYKSNGTPWPNNHIELIKG